MCAVFLAAVSDGFSQESMPTVFVTVEGFRNEDGVCRLLVFKNKKGFPDSIHFANHAESALIRERTAEFSFALAPGVYAIAVLHDENENHAMDKTWYGKPLEGFGASNDPKVNFSPPRFEQAMIRIGEDDTYLRIALRYVHPEAR
jgi:uncharacterized protein (DUF2141 family)